MLSNLLFGVFIYCRTGVKAVISPAYGSSLLVRYIILDGVKVYLLFKNLSEESGVLANGLLVELGL